MSKGSVEQKYIKYSIVIAAFDEEENLPELYRRLTKVTASIGYPYEIIFVDDGSTDRSFEIIRDLCTHNSCIKGLRFSRNFGHQMALAAGLDHACGEAVIMMDADLQHPPELIPEMLKKWEQGFEIVYTIRKSQGSEGLVKGLTSSLFYMLLNRISSTPTPAASPDFRLMGRKSVDNLRSFPERARFTRGLVSWMGYNQTGIEFESAPRHGGSTKYSLPKMIGFAFDAITSFSSIPLLFSAYLGFLMTFIAFIYGLYALMVILSGHAVIKGWSSTIMVILILGGVQLISIGIMGIYIGKMYQEVKSRPLYLIRESIGFESKPSIGEHGG